MLRNLPSTGSKNKLIQHVRGLIRDDNQITQKSLAEKFSISRSHFNRKLNDMDDWNFIISLSEMTGFDWKSMNTATH